MFSLPFVYAYQKPYSLRNINITPKIHSIFVSYLCPKHSRCYEYSAGFARDSCRNVCNSSYKCSLFWAKILTYRHSFLNVSNIKFRENLFRVPGVVYVWTQRQTDTHKTRIRPPLFKVFFCGHRENWRLFHNFNFSDRYNIKLTWKLSQFMPLRWLYPTKTSKYPSNTNYIYYAEPTATCFGF
jgi:hypothetical protein